MKHIDLRFALCLFAATAPWIAPRSVAAEPQSHTYVGVARSEDGLVFHAAGEVLLRDAISPVLVRMDHGELLAVCKQIDGAGGEKLIATRSKDGGRTWLPVRPVQVEGLPATATISSLSLVAMPGGLVRMYFAVEKAADRAQRRAMILSAVTRDGADFTMDRLARTVCERMSSVRLTAIRDGHSIVLLTAGHGGGASPAIRAASRVLVSSDGRRFRTVKRPSTVSGIGSIVQIGRQRWRMYIAESGEVRCCVSDDLVQWRDEPGVCLQGAADAAVSMLDDGTFVMLYNIVASESSTALPPLAPALPPAVPPSVEYAAEPPSSWEPFAVEPVESAGSGAVTQDPAAEVDGSETGTAENQLIELAALPDLRNHFDYLTWCDQQFSLPSEENAFSMHEALTRKMESTPESDVFSDRYNDENGPGGPPAPWSPADSPAWEKTYQEKQEYMAMFREASLDPRTYREPLAFPEEMAPEDRLLVQSNRPSLAPFRLLTKATLSQAWRAENGSVPPEQMLTAVETCLGNVAQLQESPFFINRCVAEANRQLVDENVRWAIGYGVLGSPDDLASTLSLLQTKDLPDADPGGFLREQQAAAMEAIQYLFESPVPGGEPMLRTDRVNRFVELERWLPEDRERNLQKLQGLTPADAEAAVAEIDSYFRTVAEWYAQQMPRPDPSELDGLVEQIRERNRLAGMLLPSVGKPMLFMQRTEAARRATRLICSAELFRAQRGRYPNSLDELPAEQIQDVRIDPFSGQDFVYRQTAAGPVIYSVSDNGQDDGGVHSGQWGYDQPPTESGDYVFWPPQR